LIAESKTVYSNLADTSVTSIPEVSLLALNPHEPSSRVQLERFDELSGEITENSHAVTECSPASLNNSEATLKTLPMEDQDPGFL
jgi:hypothetical protein